MGGAGGSVWPEQQQVDKLSHWGSTVSSCWGRRWVTPPLNLPPPLCQPLMPHPLNFPPPISSTPHYPSLLKKQKLQMAGKPPGPPTPSAFVWRPVLLFVVAIPLPHSPMHTHTQVHTQTHSHTLLGHHPPPVNGLTLCIPAAFVLNSQI